MGFAMVKSAVVDGLNVCEVRVEADTSNGLPLFHMVGYLSSEVKEAGERVRTAIRHTGIKMQPQKMVVNLSPADIRKRGASFDLPIAVALAVSAGIFADTRTEDALFIGELGLNASVRKVNGILPIVAEARKKGYRLCIVPKENEAEGGMVEGIKVCGVSTLGEVWDYLNSGKLSSGSRRNRNINVREDHEKDFSEMCGQRAVKRAAEIAASGGHNILYIGAPGSGKTMAAQRMATILPRLTEEEMLETTGVYSVAGLLREECPMITIPPFREVHHTITRAALVGGGLYPVPGEISLANRGVLFLDELTEFQKPVLEALREPLETKEVHIVRKRRNYIFPANVILTAAMNPCPCGYYPDYEKCSCTPGEIHRYLGRVSQPLLDRIDICMEAPRVTFQELNSQEKEETSAQIRERVIQTRNIQNMRYKGTKITTNAEIPSGKIKQFCELERKERGLLEKAFERMGLTARSCHKILKVARTIADMEMSERIKSEHLAEAISYRYINSKLWGGVRDV